MVCRPAAGECEVADFCPGDGPDCKPGEQNAGAKYDEALKLQCPSPSCAVDAIAKRVDCVGQGNDMFGSCVDDCRPGFAGRCAITRDCVNKCRDELTSWRANCIGKFKSHIIRKCGGRHCLATAKQERRLFRRCLHGAAAPIRETRGTDAAQVTGARPSLSLTDSCPESCVRRIVGSCYDDCQDQCEGDPLALPICRQACKDAQCGELRTVCNCERGIDCEGSAPSTGRN